VPAVSVVMPVYNGARFLTEAIGSIVRQTFRDWELIVVDDCSTDGTAAILAQARDQDNRIRIYRLPENQGATKALNEGARHARAALIARMDADDVSLPTRLETQVRFLGAHPEIAVLGSWVRRIDENGVLGARQKYPTDSALIAWSFFFFNPLAHPTVMMRRNVLNVDAVYDAQYRLAQDYALFMKLSRTVAITNVPEILLHYRTWSGNSSRKPAQRQIGAQIARQHAEALGVNATNEQMDALLGLASGFYPTQIEDLSVLGELIINLRTAVVQGIPRTMNATAINVDAAVRIWQLSIHAATRAPRLSLRLALTAWASSPRSIFSVARKVLERLKPGG
jgi:hypothetical protein